MSVCGSKKKETRSEWLTDKSNYGIIFRGLLADKAANYFALKIYLSSHGNQENNETWFDATLVYRFNECNRRSYNVSTYLPFLHE